MTLTELINEVRLLVPSATNSAVSDAQLTSLLNRGVNEVNMLGKVYYSHTEFTTTASRQEESLASKVPRYLGMYKSGVWYKDSAGNLQPLIPKSTKWLDNHIQNWRDASAGEPIYSYTEGDILGFHPKPDTARTARVYHLIKGVDMDVGDNYPWVNTTSEVTALLPMDDAIVAYVRWKLQAVLGSDVKGIITEQEFEKQTLRRVRIVKRRIDATSHRDYSVKVVA